MPASSTSAPSRTGSPRLPTDRPSVSLLGRALLDLDETVDQLREGEERSRDLLRVWEARWECSQTRIAQRLRVIDEQLAGTGTTAANTCPRLGLIGVPSDAGEMAPMVG